MYRKRIKLNHLLKKLHVPPKKRVGLLKLGIPQQTAKYNEALAKLNAISPFPTGTSVGTHSFKEEIFDLAIIVVTYNNQDYIDKCISSLVEQQTKYTFSIIVVNDGSTDRTAMILTDWAKRFPNIQLINCQHGGVARARNVGLNASAARYISFVDADDYVEKDYVESLMNPASKYDADIVEGSYQTINKVERFVNETDLKANAFQALHGYPWGKVYRRSLFENVKFPEDFWFEDTMGIYRIWPNADKIITISDIIYNYRINDNGITRSAFSSPKALDSLYITIRLLEDCRNVGMSFSNELYTFTLQQIVTNYIRIHSFKNDDLIAAFSIMAKLIDDYFSASQFTCLDADSLIIEKALRAKDYPLFIAASITKQ
ncbi:hypothetical protein DN448_07650 [Lactobacillus reuteri]|uniref:glycosyltransferase family 2 protein n=1 Tax=Limosilactobacillus reuteri TaxID=1598 RepID=UPI00128C2CC0|nr:glycosyltransferase [Limosilactobacillus reuteri]MQB71669.1 hypothetical protein [Limosilactobacillus reuteri]MQB84981.1 hypothetical protein [Limosilactobacillus reuteri]